MNVVITLAVAVIVVMLVKRLLDQLTSPLVKSAARDARAVRAARTAARLLPEGRLLNVQDLAIMELGEAMLLDGASTKEINMMMVEMWQENAARRAELLSSYRTTIEVVGY